MKLLETLEEIREDIWINLLESVDQQGNAFRYPVIATISGDEPLQRTVVLRNTYVSNRTLLIHTDKRSRKIDDLSNNPALSWLFYDPRRRIQLHMKSTATIHEPGSELHENEWNATDDSERRMYSVKHPPGTAVDKPTDVWPGQIWNPATRNKQIALSKPHFRVVTAEIYHMDWLQLHPEGEFRAIFEWKEGAWTETWACP